MRKIKSEKKLCFACMEVHKIDTVELTETQIFKEKEVTFKATYEYCSNSDDFLETEEMIRANNKAMRDAYKKLLKKGVCLNEES